MQLQSCYTYFMHIISIVYHICIAVSNYAILRLLCTIYLLFCQWILCHTYASLVSFHWIYLYYTCIILMCPSFWLKVYFPPPHHYYAPWWTLSRMYECTTTCNLSFLSVPNFDLSLSVTCFNCICQAVYCASCVAYSDFSCIT